MHQDTSHIERLMLLALSLITAIQHQIITSHAHRLNTRLNSLNSRQNSQESEVQKVELMEKPREALEDKTSIKVGTIYPPTIFLSI